MPGDVVTLDADAMGPCELIELRGREAMNALPAWTVQILTPEPIDLAASIRAAARLQFLDEFEGAERFIPAMVVDIVAEGLEKNGHSYEVTLAPAERLLTLRSGYRVFVEKTTEEIVSQVLRDGGIASDQVKWRLAGTYMKRPQCVQYGETDWSFVERLLADEGIAYWFEAKDDDGPLLVLGDDHGSHEGIRGSTTIPFQDARGMVGPRSFFELEIVDQLTSDAVHLRDFDVRQPSVYIEARAGEGAFEVFEYPARVVTKDAARRRAQVRLEQLRREGRVLVGRTNCTRLQPGRLLDIEGCTDEDGNGRHLLIEIEHTYRRPVPGETGAARPYRNRVRLVPAPGTHRPAIPRTAPRVPGIETAMTTGPSGEEIHVDDLGRLKIRFFWDRSGIGDDRSSAWVRCLQMGMGGSMLLPRVGWEVPVAYMHGDPDRPVVLGRVYNASQVVPYGLPGAAATTALQSATSPGGGSANEIRMSDVAGAQEMYVHATKDQSVGVGGSSTIAVGGNETLDVGLSHAIKIGASHTHAVSGAQSANVGTSHGLQVKGARSETISGSETNDVGANRGVTTSLYAEIIGGFYGLRCNQANSKITGARTELVGGSLNMVAALGTGENVAAIRAEVVSGARTILAGKYHESVRGSKSVGAGSATDKAGAKVIMFATGGGHIKAASADISAGGPAKISAPTITVQVGGTIDMGGASIGGGKLHASNGTTKIKGTIKRQDKSEIE
jgi:type VI secretion system secreted protein VgrG